MEKIAISEEQFKKIYKQVENSKSIVEVVVITLIYIENKIERYLINQLPRSDYLWKDNRYISYENKLKFALSLGFINNTKMWGDFIPRYKQLNELRNKFAHNLDYQLKEKDIEFLNWANQFFSDPEFNKVKPTLENLGELEYTKRGLTIFMSLTGLFAG
jgi:hypothetical protein